ncbi:MAG TPA: phosphatidate cytidylyltransferase [Symbiobacteriaceae bacterium]|nr:phosphatidate cytidylyltransferase [Symbiobacteriaceae bacterium]
MLIRIATALVGIPLFLGALYVGKWPLFALVAGMGLVGFFEFTRILRAKGVQVAEGVGYAGVLGLLLWAQMAPASSALLGGILTAVILLSLLWLLKGFPERTWLEATATVGGVVYTGFLLSHLLLLRNLGGGSGWDLGLGWVALAFFCTWSADSFAYFAGRAFGRRKLAPKISPGKSVEGFFGGLVGAVIVGALWAPVIDQTRLLGAGVGLAVALIAPVGDLAESALKRYAGVKDSGKLLPGHGGVLDRFDSSLFVLPVVYYVVILLGGR